MRYIRVAVNDKPVDIQVQAKRRLTAWKDPAEPPTSGEVSLCSMGGVHEFDGCGSRTTTVRRRDMLDCIKQAMEAQHRRGPRLHFRPVHGGTGAYILGIHAPGLVAAVSPNAGASDLVYDFEFLKEHFPVNYGAPYRT